MRNTAQFPREKTASLREAKAKLSRLTKQAKAGTRVVITNHGTPVADLVQHGTGAIPIRHLKHPGPLPMPVRLRGNGPSASELVLMDRAG